MSASAVGAVVGLSVGRFVGSLVGLGVGRFVGNLVGLGVGGLVGLRVGLCASDSDAAMASGRSKREITFMTRKIR